MARPRSDDRRKAILSAATRVIATSGLGAATAVIAKEAGVSNGSLFVYFETKAALVNEVYLALKTEMAAAAIIGLPSGREPREQMFHVWTQWMRWATSHPEKRRALAQLGVSDEVTAESHRTAGEAFSGIAKLFELSRTDGPMHDAPLGLVLSLTNAVAEATIDAMISEPAEAGAHSIVGFEAMWRVLAWSPSPPDPYQLPTAKAST
ncbi:TetR/AcrR family transcriptional regulator [Streptomyces sp. NPDC101455]|uniref:TetR/AcrR family transcriptional regulator n=1 Tax=Streptomyces sp. NPDC101455 TaxID=3366142 RepID=UPI00380198AD